MFPPPSPHVSENQANASVGSTWDVGSVGRTEGAITEGQGCQFHLGESQSCSQGCISIPIFSSSISSIATASLTSVDLSAIDEPATQPKLKQYPISVFGHEARSFSLYWYRKYAFLHYRRSKDTVFCKMCQQFGEIGGEE